MSAAFVNLKKLTGAAIVKTAARHNLREIQAELGASGHINAAQSCQNMRLAGPETAAEVADLADNAMQDAGVGTLRKDAVRAVELVVSLPAGSNPAKVEAFFADALEWVRGFFGAPVLSAVVHLDEEAPHMHALLLPLANGRMVGSDLVGNRERLQAMQTGFFESVACRYGLSRPRPEKRLSRAIRGEAATAALACLQSHPEHLQLPSVRTALHESIATNPLPVLVALGLEMPTGKTKKGASFVEIMTKPCRPEPRLNPIGFDAPAVMPESKPYPCVGFANQPEHQRAPKPTVQSQDARTRAEKLRRDDSPHDDAAHGGYERVRDDAPGIWNDETGELVPIPAKPPGDARTWARAECARLRGSQCD